MTSSPGGGVDGALSFGMELGRIMKAMLKTGCGASHNGRPAGRWSSWLCVAVFLCGAWGSAPAQEFAPVKTLPDLVAESEWIVVADLVDTQARRNARGNLIVTDMRFHPTQTLIGTPSGAEFVLTQGGGSLAGETQRISDTPHLDVGQRYLLFVRPGRGEMFAPFVGGAQGVYLLGADDKAVSLGGDRRRFDRERLLNEVQELIGVRGTALPRIPQSPHTAPGTYPSKDYLPVALTPPMGAAVTASPQLESAMQGPSAPEARAAGGEPIAAGSVEDSSVHPNYVWPNLIAPPAVINGFPHDWTPWWPEDEYQMSKWNQYGGDVFRVFETPDLNWAYGNDRFDLAGWPDDAQMMAQFGEPWCCGFSGITYSRWFDGQPILESDTALNPAYCWTLDDRSATDPAPGGCEGFRQTMAHELGHGWGLAHPWETQAVWWDSIMNYSPRYYRLPQLYADDTNAVRNAFAGPGMHDALLSLYTTAEDTDGEQSGPIYTPTQIYQLPIRHGEDIAAWITNQFKIENLGTDEIVSPIVEFYLSKQRMNWDAGYAFLTSATYVSVPVFFTYTYFLPYMPVPATTPTGDYWFAAYLPGADGNPNNNSAWANEDVKVHIDNNATTLTPETYWQSSEFGYLGPAGDWTFSFHGDEGTTYYISMCPDTGGWADFDTTLAIEYFGSELAFDDDTCDYQSNIVWTAPYSATFTIRVNSYNDEYQGTFQLGYRRDVTEIIFRGGFDG